MRSWELSVEYVRGSGALARIGLTTGAFVSHVRAPSRFLFLVSCLLV